MIVRVLFIIFVFFCTTSSSFAYFLGIKSADNTSQNIEILSRDYLQGVYPPVVSFFFDTRNEKNAQTLDDAWKKLPQSTVFHVSLSPNMLTAKQVAQGGFDQEYMQFFQFIKERDIHVLFRTMHEMNGGRYAWGSNPYQFRQARLRMRTIAKLVGVDSEQIAFVFSFNHRDAPTRDRVPSKQSVLIFCDLMTKLRTGCSTFEDYYPGDDAVDIVGFTYYNRGKASYHRKRLTSSQILEDPRRNTLSRARSLGKPLIIDEVATSAIWYAGSYSGGLSQASYHSDYQKKNAWLLDFHAFMQKNPDLLGAIYFNADFTNGLSQWIEGEADWSVVNVSNGKIYQSFFRLFAETNLLADKQKLASLFGKVAIRLGDTIFFVPNDSVPFVNALYRNMLTDEQKKNLMTDPQWGPAIKWWQERGTTKNEDYN